MLPSLAIKFKFVKRYNLVIKSNGLGKKEGKKKKRAYNQILEKKMSVFSFAPGVKT